MTQRDPWDYTIKAIELGQIATKKLTLREDSEKLLNVWKIICKERDTLFRQTGYEDLNNLPSYPKIQVSMYPVLSAGYDPSKNIIKLNILTLFFTIIKSSLAVFLDPKSFEFNSKKENYDVIINPFLMISGILLHELDHYLFSKENDLIGSEKEKIDDFTRNKMEIRAYCKEIDFYKKYKDSNPLVVLIPVKEIIQKHTMDYRYIPSAPYIDNLITHIQAIVETLKNTKASEHDKKVRYEQSVEKDDLERFRKIGKLFSLKNDKDKGERESETAELDWNIQPLT